MRQADFKAQIKKIEIVNKVVGNRWVQSIRVNLGDIELTNENLLELRQFHPNEPVYVVIKPAELNLLDMMDTQAGAAAMLAPTGDKDQAVDCQTPDEDLLTFSEADGDIPPPGKVIKEFKF
ncbi:hypothetical protein SAMN05660649_00560 [Desulfotomaculum arcticum]|uniref:Uncharacterized protein n=1 Tax=Desulfotruncus arcticus DSM 17038 TaxID=1121424 RepID=A0A1I2NTH2_9FIRM|nr:hypothetical protein [Desulfotruncus arcticus]SFG07038.1 hypothetical protein SAMN05660649_00560 [Desulfotomaculum arcticum] [Desulfotruncus arcticus DSM 17038]